jgi:hypothetical protein
MLYSAKLVMLNAVYTDCCNWPHYAECNYAKRHYDECHYAQCRGAIFFLAFLQKRLSKSLSRTIKERKYLTSTPAITDIKTQRRCDKIS